MPIKVSRKDIQFEPVKGGIHAGGQHANKNATGVRATHIPTGIVCVIRGRSLQNSKRKAVAAIRKRVKLEEKKAGDRDRKAQWKKAIKDRTIIRTYSYPRGEVIDHRTGETAPLKQVVEKGNLDLLQTLNYLSQLRQQ